MDEKNTLYHYGVPGMKWGVRKARNDVSTTRRNAKADNSGDEDHEDYKKTVSRKSLKSMSTKEIQEVNARIQAENQFEQLTERKQSAFEKAAKEVLMNVAKQSATKFIQHYADAGINKVVGKIDNTKFGKFLGLDQDSKDDAAVSEGMRKLKIADRIKALRDGTGTAPSTTTLSPASTTTTATTTSTTTSPTSGTRSTTDRGETRRAGGISRTTVSATESPDRLRKASPDGSSRDSLDYMTSGEFNRLLNIGGGPGASSGTSIHPASTSDISRDGKLSKKTAKNYVKIIKKKKYR